MPHPLAGHFSVDASARRIRHYRYAEERLMRILGGWIALTPELPAKLLFGRHVWDCAQHADAWGRRLPELRAAAQQSEPASEAVVRVMDAIDALEGAGQTVERLAAVYRVLKPHLITVYERHLAATNPVYEPPTRRILERCLEEERRHVAAGAVVFQRVAVEPGQGERASACERRLLEALAAAGGVTGDVEPPLVTTGIVADPAAVARDLVNVPPPFDPAHVPPDLTAAVDALAQALAAGDRAGAEALMEPAARGGVLAEPAGFAGRFGRWRMVALAAVGRYRIVKLRLEGPGGRVTLQTRWAPSPGGWRVTAAEVVSAEAASATDATP